MIDYDSIYVNTARKKTSEYIKKQVSDYVSGYESDIAAYNSFDGSDSSYEKLSSNIKSKISYASSLLENLKKYNNLFDDKDYCTQAESAVSTLSDYYASSLNSLKDKKIASKYKGYSVDEIDAVIADMGKSQFFSSPDNQRELKWLTTNRDSFMTTDELKAAISELEGNSTALKSKKRNATATAVGSALNSAFAGTGLDTDIQNELINAKNAETENSEKLDRYKTLLSLREDVSDDELYEMYHEADSHSIFDVLKSDYTYADYANDRTDKRIYGSAYSSRENAVNSKVIDSDKELQQDLAQYAAYISSNNAASSNPYKWLTGSMDSEAYQASSPETISIKNKWTAKGYDFDSLYKTYKENYNADFTEQITDKVSDFTQKNAGNAVLANVGSVATNLIGGITALPEAVGTGLKDLVTDDVVTMDTNSSAWTLKNVTDTVRNTTSQMLEDSEHGKLKSFLYQTGMSTADFLSTAAVTGFAEPATLLIMGSNAAVDTMKTVTENGGSASDAMFMGVLSGAFETLCEKFSVEALFKSVGTATGREWLYNIFKGMVSEGSEELTTDLMNTAVDILLNADQSEFKQNVFNYMRTEGLSAQDASAKVLTDTVKDMALSFAGGALSGGLMSFGGGAIGLSSANKTYKETGSNVLSYEGGTDAVMELAREIVAQNQDIDGTVSNDIKKAEKKASAKNVGRLYSNVQNNLNNQTDEAAKNEAISGIKARVEALGMDSSTSQKAAEIIYKAYTGEKLTARQESIFKNNKYVSRAYRELSASDSAVGRSNYSNEWAEDVKSNVISASADVQSKALNIAKYSVKNPETEMSAEEKTKKTATVSGTDDSVIVNKIVEKTDNGFIAELTNGKEVVIETEKTVSETPSELDTVTFDDIDMSRAVIYASNYGTAQTANAYIKTVASSDIKDVKAFQQAFNTVYQQGLRGEEMNLTGLNITLAQADIAYTSGVNDAEITDKKGKGRVDGTHIVNIVKNSSYEKGITRLDTATELDETQGASLKVLDAYGKKHGISFITVDSFDDGKTNGAQVGKDKIIISLDAEGGAYLSVAGHEVYHYLEKNNPEDAKAIREFVINYLKNVNKKYDYNARFEELATRYGTEDIDIIESEMTANAMFEVLNNEKTIAELADENPSLLEKIRNAIKEFIEELKRCINSLTWAEKDALKNETEMLETIKHMFDTAMKNIEVNKNTARTDGAVKYSIVSDDDGGYVKVDANQKIFDGKNIREMQEIACKIIKANFKGKVLSLDKTGKAYINKRSAEEYAYPANRRMNDTIKEAKMRASTELDNLLAVSKFVEHQNDDGRHSQAIGGWDVYSVRFEVANVMFSGEVKIMVTDRGYVFYDVTKIERLPVNGGQTEYYSVAASGNPSIDSIYNSAKNVNNQSMQNGKKNSDTRYSLNSSIKITPEMSEEERAEVLKNTKITVAQYNGDEELSGKAVLKLKSSYRSEAVQILKSLSEKFGVFKKYSNDNIELEFNYSRGSLNESVHKQGDLTTDFYDFAKMLYVFDDVVANAVPIEVHTDKYAGTKRENPNLKYDYVLLSAFGDGEYITPVEFHVKEFKKTAKDLNKLYVSITLGKIKIENKIMVQVAENQNNENQWRNTPLFSEISIPQLVEKINLEYGNFYKYIPSELLTKEQIKSKNTALEDENYRLKVMRGEDVNDILADKAKEKGYNTDFSWRMDHRAPNAKDDICITDIDRAYGGDGSIYSANAAYYYGDGRKYDYKAINAIKSVRNSPEKLITIYRAVPKNIKDTRIRNGDWVTVDIEYAQEHGWRMFDDNYRIIKNKVPAKTLFTDGNSIHEFGYDNGNLNEVYKNTDNNVKLKDVTYDDSGNLIPLSKRFDENNSDIRYSLKETADAARSREQLLKDNDNLRVANAVLKDEMKLTKGKTISLKNAQTLANQMLREFDSKYDSQTLAKKLYDIFRWYDSNSGSADYAIDYIATVAQDVIAKSSSRDTSLYEEYAEAREWIRNMRFTLPEKVLKQLNENYDGQFRQKTFGKMQFVSKTKNPDVMYLSAMYSELADAYPNFFSIEDNEYEQPQKLLDFWEAIQPTYNDIAKEMGYSSDMEAAVGFAYTLFEKYIELPNHETFADKLKKEYSRNLAEAKKKFRAKLDKKIAKRMETQARAKMRKDVISKVKKLSNMLTKPTDQKHIPDQLKTMVAQYLMIFADDSVVFNEAAINRVTRAYTKLVDEDNGSMEGIRQYYDPDVLKKLERLTEIAESMTDGNRLSVLDNDEMNLLVEITDHFYHLVNNANEIFVGEKKKNFNDLVSNIIMELNGQKSKTVKASFEATSWDTTPYYFFKRIGGTFNELFKELLNGQHKYGLLMAEAKSHLQALGEKYKISQWKNSDKYIVEITKSNDEKIQLTANEALGIYAIARREEISGQESKHLTEGGIVFKDNSRADGNNVLSIVNIQTIISSLTDEQRNYADEVIEYLSTTVGGWGNEASLKMFGYKKFNEAWYYPFHTAENFKKKADDKAENSAVLSLLKNKSFTKSTVHGAATPVYVENFTDVVGNHIAEMISYNTLAQAQSNLNAVFNYTVKNISVRNTLEKGYGTKAKEYVGTLIKDLSSGATFDPNEKFADKMLSKFKKNAVAANLSVIVQQPSAVGRAMALIDPKYFLTKSPKGGYEECKKYAGVAVIKEIGGFDTSTGVGSADWIMQTDPDSAKDKLKSFWLDSSYRDDKFGWAAGKADELTWAYIWQAVKAEVADKQNLKDEELLKAAGVRFNEVIEATQVYDSVLTRSQFMRGKSTWTKMASAFMAEPTKRINMLYDAAYNYAVNKDAESGKYLMRTIGSVLAATIINAVLKSFITAGRDDDENQAFMEKYIEALISNSFSELSVMQGLPIIKDMISILQGYDVSRTDMDIVTNAVDAIGSIIDFVSDVNNAEFALMTDAEKFKAVADMINDFFGSLGAFIGLPTKNIARDGAMLVNTIQSIFDNKKPTSSGVKYSATDALIGLFDTAIGNPLDGCRVDAKDLFKDIQNGNEEEFAEDWDEYQAYLIYSGKTETKAYSTVKKNVKEQIKINLFKGKITDEQAEEYLINYLGADDGYWIVKEWRFDSDEANEGISFSKYLWLENAVLNGEDISDEVKELTEHNTKEKNVQTKVTEIIEEAFEKDEISESKAQELLSKYKGFAANQSITTNSVDEDKDVNRLVDKWVGNKDLPDGEYYTAFSPLSEAVLDNMSIESAKEKLYDLEYDDSEINTQIRATVQEAYLDGTLTKREASARLQKYTEMSSEDAEEKLDYWTFKNENPESNLSEAGIKKYLEAEESGVSLSVFEGYYDKLGDIESDKDANGKTVSGSKRTKVLALIDSLPISSKQKDVLYYQNNYSSSTLYSAPWH